MLCVQIRKITLNLGQMLQIKEYSEEYIRVKKVFVLIVYWHRVKGRGGQCLHFE